MGVGRGGRRVGGHRVAVWHSMHRPGRPPAGRGRSVLAAQSFVLRPLLVARVLRIIAGESVPPSQVHNLYLALEAVLLVLILAVGIFSIRHLESDQL
jgi:hypothetical protein